MSTDKPGLSDQPEPANHTDIATDAENAAAAPETNLRWKRLRLFALGALTVIGSSILCVGMLTASAAWYTSRSQFCSSCHIMDPYYESWQRSPHADVACIKCHFAPGIGEKVRGKMQGLVQLCTYITRSEGPRPVAEVADASCLRSGCHERRSLAGPLDFHGILFDHAAHLEHLNVGAPAALPAPAEGAQSVDNPHVMQLGCTSCHTQVTLSEHMSVSTATCFLCHFKAGHFNEGAGACTRCHQIPHEEFDLGGGITFTHELVYENGVDCKSCHGELNRGDGYVARVRCQVCHNREADLEKIADSKLMHDIHVTVHKADCLDCHTEIAHSLQPHGLTQAASDCASCHPDHHREQINMLLGVGGQSIPDQVASMSTSGVQCQACHRVKQVSATGTVLWKASADVCTACHTSAAAERVEDYQQDVRASMSDVAAALERVRTAMETADVDVQQLSAWKVTLTKLKHDLEFLNIGNGIHNIHYSSTLARVLYDETTALCQQLNVPGPTTPLPASIERLD
jgi:predicted CXXCH cytochrome family protein